MKTAASILSLLTLFGCTQRPWVRGQIECGWDDVSNGNQAIIVADQYLTMKGRSDYFKDSVRVSQSEGDYLVFFQKKEFVLPFEIAILVTPDGCASYIPLK